MGVYMKKLLYALFAFIFSFVITCYFFNNNPNTFLMVGHPIYTASSTLNITRRNPVGEIVSFMGNNAPQNFLKCDGSVYNISDYPTLAEHFEIEFGSKNYFGGDGSTTFAVPDLRGEFLRSTGTNSHFEEGSGSIVGTHQSATTINHVNRATSTVWLYISNQNTSAGVPNNYDYYKNNGGKGRIRISGSAESYSEYALYTARPTNTSVLYIIRYN